MIATATLGRPARMPDAGEAALLRRCQEGDEEAFRDLMERYQRRTYWIAYHMLGNYETAREISTRPSSASSATWPASTSGRTSIPGSTRSSSTSRSTGCGRCPTPGPWASRGWGAGRPASRPRGVGRKVRPPPPGPRGARPPPAQVQGGSHAARHPGLLLPGDRRDRGLHQRHRPLATPPRTPPLQGPLGGPPRRLDRRRRNVRLLTPRPAERITP